MTVAGSMQTRLRPAAKDYEAARATLDEAIREAVAAGGSLREVGDLSGFSHEQVRRIVQRGEAAGQRDGGAS